MFLFPYNGINRVRISKIQENTKYIEFSFFNICILSEILLGFLCPKLRAVDSIRGRYIYSSASSSTVSRKLSKKQRKGKAPTPEPFVEGIQSRWAQSNLNKYKQCNQTERIPKAKLNCDLQCEEPFRLVKMKGITGDLIEKVKKVSIINFFKDKQISSDSSFGELSFLQRLYVKNPKQKLKNKNLN